MPDKQPLKPDQLGELYPKAKSYDELADERAKVHEIKEAQKPKFIQLRASLLLTIACALAAGAVWAVPYALRANVMTGVFAAFALLLIIAWFVWRAVTRINYLYELYGYNARPFLLIYLMLLGASVALLQSVGWDRIVEDKTTIAVVFFMHFVATQLLARVTRKIGKS